MPGLHREWLLATAEDTASCAAAFARAWLAMPAESRGASGRATRLALQGELGAGKTTWVRGFVAAMGITDPVPSPSYALVQNFVVREQQILHADFYRLIDPADFDALALDDADRPGTLWLIEWPERAAGRCGVFDLYLEFAILHNAHQLRATAATDTGGRWLSQGLD